VGDSSGGAEYTTEVPRCFGGDFGCWIRTRLSELVLSQWQWLRNGNSGMDQPRSIGAWWEKIVSTRV